jgi:hypothetical protein
MLLVISGTVATLVLLGLALGAILLAVLIG